MAEEIKHGSRYNFPAHLSVSSGPHVKESNSVRSIMLDVIIALMPAYIWGILVFGTRALALGIISVASCVIFEFIFQLICGRENTIGDLSAVVTGLILSMNLSAGTPYWLPVVGAFFAIVVVKGLFGGIGKNIMNPALAARVFMFLAWPDRMKIFTAAGNRLGFFSSVKSADIVASATPLTALHSGQTPTNSTFDMFIGNLEGCIGEVSVLFLLIGAVYLFARRVITWHTPVAYIASVAVVALLFPRVAGDPVNSMLTEVFSGGLIFCAFFMATDYATTPVAPLGKLIFGVGCGIITVLIRYFGGYSEGASFSILIMNLLVWYIDRLTLARFGKRGGKSNVGK
ncbi:MAG: RnfABCDGE type electron transport complex subunit D [Clostridia bacterium]|nr:RnfABCDGE type electron transport complex subunit D [Clostridia bacterium]